MQVIFRSDNTEIKSDGKTVIKRRLYDDGVIECEYKWSQMFSHENIMKYTHIDSEKCIYMKHMDGDLYKFMFEYTHDELFKIISQVVYAISHMASLGISHNDIKAKNILIDEDKAFITDFGSCGYYGLGGELTTITDRPPEMPLVETGSYTDVWSLGTIIFECIYKKPIIPKGYWKKSSVEGLAHTLNVIPDYNELKKHQHVLVQKCPRVDHILYDIMIDCLVIDYKLRPHIDDIIKKYFSN